MKDADNKLFIDNARIRKYEQVQTMSNVVSQYRAMLKLTNEDPYIVGRITLTGGMTENMLSGIFRGDIYFDLINKYQSLFKNGFTVEGGSFTSEGMFNNFLDGALKIKGSVTSWVLGF
jgi:hypothetical protein